MFKPTSRQRTLFEPEQRLGDSQRRRLKGTWAEGFHAKVLPVLLDAEEDFAPLYSDATGRPNWSAARMVGICVLQEMLDLDDQSALDCLSFDVRWQHALGLEPESAYLSRRSLVEFRSRLAAHDPEMSSLRSLFERIGKTAIAELGLSVAEQRLDSTLITSNIFTRGRVELFTKTLVHFMRWLVKEHPERVESLKPATQRWYEKTKDSGWFAKVDKKTAKKQAAALAKLLYDVVSTFEEDEAVTKEEPYCLVARLLAEHCEVRGPSGGGGSGEAAGGKADTRDESAEVEVRGKMANAGSSLQSPYDPDAGLSYKGPGYLLHVTETCRNESTEIITDFEIVPAGNVDRNKEAEVIDRLVEAELAPEALYEDGGYVTGQGIIDAAKKGVEIVAPITGGSLPKDTIGRERFGFDEETGYCTRCPAGHAPLRHDLRWIQGHSENEQKLHAYFDGNTCRSCELRGRCVARAPNNGKKGSFHVEVSANLIARDRALAAQRDDSWWNRYKIRAGVEATMSELKRSHGIGKLRVRRLPRVRLAVSMKIAACNIKRWLRAAAVVDGAQEVVQQAVCVVDGGFQALVRLVERTWRLSLPARSQVAA